MRALCCIIIITGVCSQLKVYAGQQGMFNFIPEHHMIGFTLPNTSVSTEIPPSGSDVIIVNLYSKTLCFTYGVSVILFLVWYYYCSEDSKENFENHVKNNKDLLAGMVITAVTSLLMERVARFASSIAWTTSISNSSGSFLAVWWPQSDYFLITTSANIFCHIVIICYPPSEQGQDSLMTRSQILHSILPIILIAFGLFYTGLPAIILILAYPTQMIAILACVLSFLFATTVFSAILFKYVRKIVTEKWFSHVVTRDRARSRTTISFYYILLVVMIVPFLIWIAYIHFVAVVLLYSLIVGRGSVITTGPIFVISLLPSAFLSTVSLIAKRYWLNKNTDTNGT